MKKTLHLIGLVFLCASLMSQTLMAQDANFPGRKRQLDPVVPKFEEIFSEFDTELPDITKMLIDASAWFAFGRPPGWQPCGWLGPGDASSTD